MKTAIHVLTLLCCASAQSAVIWQDFRVSAQTGDHFRVGDKERDIYTVEHAAATWGDSFFFLDMTFPQVR